MAKTVGQLKRERRLRKPRKVTVFLSDGTIKVVKPAAFRKPSKRKPPRPPSEYQRYLRMDHWRELREAALKRDKHRCTNCNRSQAQLKALLEVHHLTYERLGGERLSDVVTVCRDCHRSHHHGLRPLSR